MTIVVDTSALVAVLLAEPEAEAFLAVIADAETLLMSEVNRYELGVVMLLRRGPAGAGEADRLVTAPGLEIRPFDAAQSAAALAAYTRYGKGLHPRAKLNLGDCAAYALATTLGVPLLFKGQDFAATDLCAAV